MKEAKTGYPVVEKTSVNYAITVTVDEMIKIHRKDNELLLEDEKTLFDLLDKLPYTIKVEYEGMFGPHIFVELGVEDDTNTHWREILKIITEYVK